MIELIGYKWKCNDAIIYVGDIASWSIEVLHSSWSAG